jgi:hypothetical protein
VTPVKVGNVVLYVQRAGRKLRELVYVFETDTMAAPDLTLLSSHITQGGVTALVHSKEPYSIVWAVRGDGALLGMTYEREEKVVGWHRHSTDGEIESLAVIPQEDADELWAVVKRTIGGVERRYVEYMTAWTDDMEQEEAFFVDSGLSYSGAPALVFSGLDHLEGQTVHVLADGAVHPACVVTAGQITLEYEASTVHAGLPYTSTLKTMRPEGGSAEGVSQGKTKRLHRAVIRVDRSLGLKVGPDADHLDTVAFREMWDAMDAAPPLFTGDVEIEIDDDYSLEAQIMMQQDLPLPCNILAVMFGLSVHD